MLNQTNIGHNNNKFYIIQLIEQNGSFSCWNRWGRVVSIFLSSQCDWRVGSALSTWVNFTLNAVGINQPSHGQRNFYPLSKGTIPKLSHHKDFFYTRLCFVTQVEEQLISRVSYKGRVCLSPSWLRNLGRWVKNSTCKASHCNAEQWERNAERSFGVEGCKISLFILLI